MNITVRHHVNERGTKKAKLLFFAVSALVALTLGAFEIWHGGIQNTGASHASVVEAATPTATVTRGGPTYYIVDSAVDAANLSALSYEETGRQSVVVLADSPEAQLILDGAAASWGDYALHVVDLRGQ